MELPGCERSHRGLRDCWTGRRSALIDAGQYRVRTMEQMRIQKPDLMAMARDQGMKSITEIELAILERNGEISLIKKEED